MNKKGLNSNQLHFIAIITMLTDHVGFIFFPENIYFRIVGRIAFPIYAFLLSEGFRHTSNVKRYALRLFVMAMVSELAFDFAFFGGVFPYANNVMWTLLLSFVPMYFARKSEDGSTFSILLSILSIVFTCGLAEVLCLDYGAKGILLVSAFYMYDVSKPIGKINSCVNLLIISLLMSQFTKISIFGFSVSAQIFCLFSLPFIWNYNGEKGIKSRNLQLFFYGFYPVHLVILYLLSRII